VAIQEYLSNTQVFNAADFRQEFGESLTDRNLLVRAVRRGRVDRPRRGLYVSKTGPYSRGQADPFDVAVKVADDVVFCFLSALELHGVAHNLTFRTQFYTTHKITGFGYAGQEYQPLRYPTTPPVTRGLLTPSGRRYQVTTREQTLVDCLARPNAAGGVENVLRSACGFAHLDVDGVLAIAAGSSATLRARLGWVLETRAVQWRVGTQALGTLAASLGAGPHYFSSAGIKHPHWVNRWRLYLPFPEQEMVAWMDQ